MDMEIILRLLLSVLWGGLVGIEREYRSKSAGFRTMIMISMGACAFTMASQYLGGTANPDRVASNIVTGIGFLGAGVIFRGHNRISGITTAATIWGVAAVGMGIGAGFYFAAACASIMILLVLALLPSLERYIDQINRAREYTIECDYEAGRQAHFEQIMKASGLTPRLVHYVRAGNVLTMTWEAHGHSRKHQQFADQINNDAAVRRLEF